MSVVSVRPYIPGDDIRAIDWKITARTSVPHVRQFVAERELTLLLVIDGSGSLIFGSQEQQKREYAAELGAVLAYSAIFNNDKVGLLIFTDKIEHYVPPAKGRKHILRLIRDLLTYQPTGTGTDLGSVLRMANRVVPKHSIVILLSDFLLPATNYESQLVMLGRQHDVSAIVLKDPLEEHIPDVGLLRVKDSETGTVHVVDTASTKWQRAFQEQRRTLEAERQRVFTKGHVADVVLSQDEDYIPVIAKFFAQKADIRS
ncbi:DUF58 domain-containing protein [Candidatus Saccharibacteria bacterium]|nr:DUF58 domain-containing protein [Candidatus Saccharibacteria bacterium]